MKKNDYQIPYVIVGAGITGLQMAYQLIKSGIAGDDIAVFEQNIFPGEHSTSRNSGVLHAGLYYPKGSLKQTFCVEGNPIWSELSKELGFSLSPVGKYVVATSKKEVFELEKLFEFASEKKVPGLEWRSGQEIKPFVHLEKAFFSKTTSIISVSEVIKSLSKFLYQKNVPVLLGQKVENIEKTLNGFELLVNGERIEASHVINCAGLFGIELRKTLGLIDLENYWVKGRYLRLNKKFFHDSLIYPLPTKELKGLGVHTSFDLDGVIRFGPDTYDVDKIDYSLDDSVIDQIYPAIAEVFKGIERKDLSVDYAGIRSKIKHNGELYTDFWLKSPISGYWECLGIESPGLTSSPAIAKHIISKII